MQISAYVRQGYRDCERAFDQVQNYEIWAKAVTVVYLIWVEGVENAEWVVSDVIK